MEIIVDATSRCLQIQVSLSTEMMIIEDTWLSENIAESAALISSSCYR